MNKIIALILILIFSALLFTSCVMQQSDNTVLTNSETVIIPETAELTIEYDANLDKYVVRNTGRVCVENLNVNFIVKDKGSDFKKAEIKIENLDKDKAKTITLFPDIAFNNCFI